MGVRRRLILREVRETYVARGRPLPAAVEEALRADERPGARALLQMVERRRRANRSEGQRLRRLLEMEREIWATGITRIAGVDEAGMSPLAGPVVAGAVILPVDFRIPGVDDSKKLDAETRERLAREIKKHAVAWGTGFAEPEEIDRINIYHAGLLAMRRAVEALSPAAETLLVDARRVDLPIPQRRVVHGDARCFSIAAASIIAKTTRDRLMCEFDARYPGYGFAKHKGYGVPQHYRALERLGVLPIHRRSFGPVRKALGLEPVQAELPMGDDGDELPAEGALEMKKVVTARRARR